MIAKFIFLPPSHFRKLVSRFTTSAKVTLNWGIIIIIIAIAFFCCSPKLGFQLYRLYQQGVAFRYSLIFYMFLYCISCLPSGSVFHLHLYLPYQQTRDVHFVHPLSSLSVTFLPIESVSKVRPQKFLHTWETRVQGCTPNKKARYF